MKRKYNLEWYYKHRKEQLKKNKQWKLNNKERVKQKTKEWRIKNHEKVLAYKQKHRMKNKEKIKNSFKKWYIKNREEQLIYKKNYGKIYYQKNRERILAWGKQHAQIPEVKARRRLMERLRNKKNPRSNRSLPLDLQFIMNQVRLRDKNTCQWFGCGLTHREAPIHVHHIFPQSEYPELAYEEKYMICYCANHHVMFHRWRGDKYSEMIGKRSYGILQEVLD